jgi:hypothetical protein
MKKLALLAVCLVSGLAAYGQGQFQMANLVPASQINSPVLDAKGGALAGTDYFVQLWAGATDSTLAPVAGSTFNFKTKGYFSAGAVTVPFAAAASATDATKLVSVQVRAWRAAAGADYAAAAASMDNNPLGNAGFSNILRLAPGGQYDPNLPASVPTTLVGLTGFSLVAVPEPTTLALGLLGAAALFLRRRS